MELLTCEGDDCKPPKIQELIQKQHKVFQELSMELPPNRKIEHMIEIEPRKNLSISNHTDIDITIKQISRA